MTKNFTLNFKPEELSWEKVNNLMPVIVQNYRSGLVLMQGFMNLEALQKTLSIGKVTFYSRTKQRLWTKGEESHHYLNLKAITCDCDKDCLLIAADPIGPTCHRGTESCFDGHMLPTCSNIALYEPQEISSNQSLQDVVNNYRLLKDPQSAARLLKTILDDFATKGIKLEDIDSVFGEFRKNHTEHQ